MATVTSHKFNIGSSKPMFQNEWGKIQRFTTAELSILKNLSLQKIELRPQGLLEPKWFTNCNSLGYLIEGTVLVSVLDSGSQMASFTVTPGQMFHIHSGALFHVENIVGSTATLLLTARHETPKSFTMSGSSGAFTDSVLGNSFDLDASVLKNRDTSPTNPKVIIGRDGSPDYPVNAHWPTPHRFDVEEMQAPTFADGVGLAKKARSQYWNILKDIAMYSLKVEDKAMREIHWHPDTVEMGYVHKGRARMSILSPDGSVDTFILESGDVYFIPASYPHQIEVLGEGPIHFMIFFDQPMPKDVGFRQVGSVMGKRMLAKIFGLNENELPDLPWDLEDPLLVAKKNPEDPVKSRL